MSRRSGGGVDDRLVEDVRAGLGRGVPVGLEEAVAPGRVAAAVAAARVLGSQGVLDAAGEVRAHLRGAGPLQALLDAPRTTDVLVNGPGSVWVDRGDGVQRVDLDLGPEAAVRALAVRLAAAAGRRLDDACPWVDARLPDGVRLHALLPPISGAGTVLSLRVPPRRALALGELVTGGGVPPAWEPVLRALVARRRSFLVTGGTGSGKTTVLATLLGLVDPAERIVVVEDSAELVPDHPHVVALQARHGNVEGAGAVGLRTLVRQSLRMRPDRVVVGECRGEEVRDLLAALNTGHEGGCGTLHANTAADVPARLEALAALAGLDRAAVAVQAASALDVVVHLRRDGALRRVVEVAVVTRGGDGSLVVLPALLADVDPRGPGRTGPGWRRLAGLLGLPLDWPVERWAAEPGTAEPRPADRWAVQG